MKYSTKFSKELLFNLYRSIENSSTKFIPAIALGLSLAAFGAACIAALVADTSKKPVKFFVEELSLPKSFVEKKIHNSAIQEYLVEQIVRKGDTLPKILNRIGINDDEALTFFKKKLNTKSIKNLKVGQIIHFKINGDGRLLSFKTLIKNKKQKLQKIIAVRSGNNFIISKKLANIEKRIEMKSSSINSSLFEATDSANIPNSVATQIVDLFSSKIDFASDLRKGDRFQVVYETLWEGGSFVKNGRVLGAEFKNQNKIWKAIWFGHSKRKLRGYYDERGKSLKKAFLKSPLRFSRVTSGFSMRKHPISGKWKQHKGIDFAAPTGTPVLATGDGVIQFRGRKGGYGKMIIIQHGRSYSTAYAHMSRFNKKFRKGKNVFKGQTIGYVGTTGWSTGPHLHYEFRVNGKAKNPNKIKIPNSELLTGATLLHYKVASKDILRRLNLMSKQETFLASL